MWGHSERQGERCQEKLNPPTPWPWTSSLYNCEKTHFYRLCHPVFGFLFRHPSKQMRSKINYVILFCFVVPMWPSPASHNYRVPLTQLWQRSGWLLICSVAYLFCSLYTPPEISMWDPVDCDIFVLLLHSHIWEMWVTFIIK